MRQLIETVRHNCDIVDARHGSDFGMCTYLLKMRELYRWEQGLSLGTALGKDEVGDWLSLREERLEALEREDFREITVEGRSLDPFDAEAVNAAMVGEGLVYSAGLIHAGRPHFFLAELEDERRSADGFHLCIAGRELARCLNAPPAMTLGSTIYLRRESLRRYLWEKYESWLWSRPQNAMARVAALYGFEQDIEQALDRMTAVEMAAIEAHERGEFEAGRVLGEGWETMLIELVATPAELMARAVRDHLADSTHTLPMLLDGRHDASLHFYAANLGGMREAIFPSWKPAYRAWVETGDLCELRDLVVRGADHWRSLARRLLKIHGEQATGLPLAIAASVEAAHF